MNFLLVCDFYSGFCLTVTSAFTFAASAISAAFASIAFFPPRISMFSVDFHILPHPVAPQVTTSGSGSDSSA
jgi:hypothetical protein